MGGGMSAPSLILATDLDGTFLGGSDAQRKELYEWLNANDDHLLIFVTGRDVDFIRELVESPGMPRPHYVIGDIGTSVLDGGTFEPILAIEEHIAEKWNDSAERVAALIDGEPGLRLQATPFRYRRSYYYDPAALLPSTLRKVEEAGYDWVLSAETFFDVLPKGVSKGPTLRRLLTHLALPEENVLVAGDTLNDLSLFESRLKGVAVGNAEAPLVERIRDFSWVYRSALPGAAGIRDALDHYRFAIAEELRS